MFAQNAGEVRSVDLAAVLGWAVLGSLGTLLLFALLLRDARKAALVTSLAVGFFFTVDRVEELVRIVLVELSGFWIQASVPTVDPLWVVVPELALLGVFAFRIVRRLKDLRKTTGFLNLLRSFWSPCRSVRYVNQGRGRSPPRGQCRSPWPRVCSVPPTRHFRILDGYARTDVMKSLFDFDNSALLERLEAGVLARAVRQPARLLCLSALNAVYLDDLVEVWRTTRPVVGLIGKNNVVASLRPLGQVRHLATGFDPTDIRGRCLSIFLCLYQRTADAHRHDPLARSGRQREGRSICAGAAESPFWITSPRSPTIAPRPSRSPIYTAPLPLYSVRTARTSTIGISTLLSDGSKVNGQFRNPEDFQAAYRHQAAFITKRIEQTIDRLWPVP
jgi:hypothetical protein